MRDEDRIRMLSWRGVKESDDDGVDTFRLTQDGMQRDVHLVQVAIPA